MVRRFLILNGLAVISVILYHATGWGYTAMFWWTDRYLPVNVPNFDQMGSLSYYGLRLIEQLFIYGIPAFIFVSGFFIAVATRRDRKTIDWQIVFSRIKNLVIPFLIWSVLILAVNWLQGERYSPVELLTTIILGRTAPPYYYVPLLIQLLLISPFLVPIARSRPMLLMVATGAVTIFLLILRYPLILGKTIPALGPFSLLNRSWFFTTYLFWFSFGIVAGFHLQNLKLKLNPVRNLFPVLLVIFFLLGVVEWEYLLRLSGQDWIGPRETLIDQLYSGAFILSFLLFEKFTPPFAAQLTDLGSKSFGIYLTHSPVLEYSARFIYHILPAILAYQAIFQPVIIVLGFGVPLTVMAIFNRTPARVFYKYVFG